MDNVKEDVTELGGSVQEVRDWLKDRQTCRCRVHQRGGEDKEGFGGLSRLSGKFSPLKHHQLSPTKFP